MKIENIENNNNDIINDDEIEKLMKESIEKQKIKRV